MPPQLRSAHRVQNQHDPEEESDPPSLTLPCHNHRRPVGSTRPRQQPGLFHAAPVPGPTRPAVRLRVRTAAVSRRRVTSAASNRRDSLPGHLRVPCQIAAERLAKSASGHLRAPRQIATRSPPSAPPNRLCITTGLCSQPESPLHHRWAPLGLSRLSCLCFRGAAVLMLNNRQINSTRPHELPALANRSVAGESV